MVVLLLNNQLIDGLRYKSFRLNRSTKSLKFIEAANKIKFKSFIDFQQHLLVYENYPDENRYAHTI
jgi:hypothetical protein